MATDRATSNLAIEETTNHKLIAIIVILLAALILVANHFGFDYKVCRACAPCNCNYSRSSVPETSPSTSDCEGCTTPCGLVQNSNCVGKTVTVSGNVESLQAKASKKGNTYYVFAICEGGYCIDAFSWTHPSGTSYSGNYDDSGYGPQLTVSGNSDSSERTANTVEIQKSLLI